MYRAKEKATKKTTYDGGASTIGGGVGGLLEFNRLSHAISILSINGKSFLNLQITKNKIYFDTSTCLIILLEQHYKILNFEI